MDVHACAGYAQINKIEPAKRKMEILFLLISDDFSCRTLQYLLYKTLKAFFFNVESGESLKIRSCVVYTAYTG